VGKRVGQPAPQRFMGSRGAGLRVKADYAAHGTRTARSRRLVIRLPCIADFIDTTVPVFVVNAHENLCQDAGQDQLSGGHQQHRREDEPARVLFEHREVSNCGGNDHIGDVGTADRKAECGELAEGAHRSVHVADEEVENEQVEENPS